VHRRPPLCAEQNCFERRHKQNSEGPPREPYNQPHGETPPPPSCEQHAIGSRKKESGRFCIWAGDAHRYSPAHPCRSLGRCTAARPRAPSSTVLSGATNKARMPAQGAAQPPSRRDDPSLLRTIGIGSRKKERGAALYLGGGRTGFSPPRFTFFSQSSTSHKLLPPCALHFCLSGATNTLRRPAWRVEGSAAKGETTPSSLRDSDTRSRKTERGADGSLMGDAPFPCQTSPASCSPDACTRLPAVCSKQPACGQPMHGGLPTDLAPGWQGAGPSTLRSKEWRQLLRRGW